MNVFKLLKLVRESDDLPRRQRASSKTPNSVQQDAKELLSNKQLSNKQLRIKKSSHKNGKSFSREKLQHLRSKKIFKRRFQQSTEEQPSKETRHLRRRTPVFLNYPREAKVLFRLWNDFGPPFVKHQEKITTTFKKAMTTLTKKLDKYPQSEIFKTMRVYHQLVSDSDTILNKTIPGHIVGLHEFFKFSQRTKERMRKQNVNLPIKSWFRECLNADIDHLQETYGKHVKDKYPGVTKMFVKLWAEYKGEGDLSVKDKNSLIQAAVKFVAYHKANRDKIDFNTLRGEHLPVNCVEHVFEAMDNDVNGDWDKVMTSWLASEKMFGHRLYNYFKNQNMFLYEGPPFVPSDVPTYSEYTDATVDEEDDYDDEEEEEDVRGLTEEFV